MEKVYEIIELLQKRRKGTLSAEEEEELSMWLGQPGAEEVPGHLDSDEYTEKMMTELHAYDAEKAWKRFNGRRSRHFSLKPLLWVAAVVIPLVSSIFLMYSGHGDRAIRLAGTGAALETGRAQAVLVLPGDRRFVLEGHGDGLVKDDGGITIRKDSAILTYTVQQKPGGKPVYNELLVPRKGEYSLRLSDGTRVYLNADTRLRYPENFGPDERTVELEGEAFFDVSADAGRPFRVKTGKMDVVVLGTSFNVNAYAETADIRTTLVRGKVALECGEVRMELGPGQQGRMVKASGKMTCEEVDVDLYTSWKDGLFKFERESLEVIMMKLERWYDVQVIYRDEGLKSARFSGDLKRYDTIDKHLDMIGMTTDICFEVQGNRVYVGHKDQRN